MSLFRRLLSKLKVLSLIIFILLISSHLLLVFYSWFALLKLGCVLYTCSSHRCIFLFSLVNQCPHQAIQPHTDQSAGRAHWFQYSLKELFFSSSFWKLSTSREYSASREERLLSCHLPWNDPVLTIVAKDNSCYLQYSAATCDTAATCGTPRNFFHSNTVYFQS